MRHVWKALVYFFKWVVHALASFVASQVGLCDMERLWIWVVVIACASVSRTIAPNRTSV